MDRRKIGITLIIGALLLWMVEKSTQNISLILGKMRCGDHYMQAVDGIVGEQSCGFNDDVYVASTLLVLLLTGFVLRITSKPE